MWKISLIGLGGFLGTVARYAVSGWVARRYGETFPWGTLVVNVVGCFIIGFLFYLTEERLLFDPLLRSIILIGFLGGLTTFSSFGLQTVNLLRDGELAMAALNVVVSNVCGIIMVWLGYWLARLT